MKTPQNAPFCIKSTEKILGGQTPPDPPPFPGLVACTAKKASYAPVYNNINLCLIYIVLRIHLWLYTKNYSQKKKMSY